jgi:putative oxidoreductase
MNSSDDAGKLVLRVALGALLLLHGIYKIGTGVDGIAGMLQGHGLPGALAWLVYIGEVLAPALLIIGVLTRPAAWIVVVNMLFAFGLVHMKDLTALASTGGWKLELQGMYLFGALAVALLGAGRYSLGGTRSRLN